MGKRDILYEIYNKKITNKQANSFLGKLFELKLPDVSGHMAIELRREWTAISFHGMPYNVVAKWRYEGWPDVCAIC